jgi:2-dehydropantoate 2-reductase
MKIVIVGPGAMGCLISAAIARSLATGKQDKDEVWLLDKNKPRAEKISRNGISVETGSGKWLAKVNATAAPKEIGQADLLIIATKSYDTKSAISLANPAITDETYILTLQNGIGNIEIISEVTGDDRVIAGTTSIGVTLLDTACIRYAGQGETIIGKLDGTTPVILRSIREIFNRAKLETKISRDIKSILWSKLIINCGINALSAVTRLKNGHLIEFEGTRRLLRQAVTEAIKVAKRKRIKLIYDDPLAKVESVCEATASNVSSMLQDILRKKRTEIDFINGVILRHGQELGIPVLVNSMLVDLVKTIEASYDLTAQTIN